MGWPTKELSNFSSNDNFSWLRFAAFLNSFTLLITYSSISVLVVLFSVSVVIILKKINSKGNIFIKIFTGVITLYYLCTINIVGFLNVNYIDI